MSFQKKVKRKAEIRSSPEGRFCQLTPHIENGNLHDMVIQLVEKPLLKLVLKETKGNQIQASSILGINRKTLRKKIKLYNITIDKGLAL